MGLNFDIVILDYKLSQEKYQILFDQICIKYPGFFWNKNICICTDLIVLPMLFLGFFEVFFCHCRRTYDIIPELCYTPEVIGQSSLNPMSVSEDWQAKKIP